MYFSEINTMNKDKLIFIINFNVYSFIAIYDTDWTKLCQHLYRFMPIVKKKKFTRTQPNVELYIKQTRVRTLKLSSNQ